MQNCPKSKSLGPKDHESPAYIFKSLLPPTKVGQSNSFKERQTWHFKDSGKSCGSFPIIMRQEKNGIVGFVLQRAYLESCTGPDTNTSEGFSTFSWNIEKGAKVSWPDHFQT